MLPAIEIKITADPTAAKSGLNEVTKAQDALEAATTRLSNERAKLDRALANNLTSEKAHAAAVAQSQKNFEAAARKAAAYAGATATVTKQSKAASQAFAGNASQVANIGAQFNDIGIMLAAGQNPFQLAMQQGTQLNQVMAQMGGGKQALKGLAAGFMSMVNPMSLATIGIIAGGAALLQWATSASDAEEDTLSLKDAVKDLKDETREAKDEIALFNSGLETLSQLAIFEEIAAKEAQIVNLLNQAEETSGRTAHSLKLAADRLQEQVDALRAGNDERNEAVSLATLLNDSLSSIDEAEKRIAASRESSNKKAEETLASLSRQNELQATINQFGSDSVQVATMRAKQEREIFDEMVRTLDVSQDVKDQLTGAFIVGQDLANLNMANGINAAAQAALAMSNELGISLAIAKQIQAMGATGVSGPDGAVQQVRSTSNINDLIAQGLATRRTYAATGGTTGGGRSGGGGGSAASGGGSAESRTEIESLLESLQTERETLESWYEESQGLLAQANATELEMLGGHNEAKLRLEEEYRERLRSMQTGYYGTGIDQAQQFFGDMASALSAGNAKMIALSEKFAKAEALINAGRAYAQVAADPSLPWFAKIPAAIGVASAISSFASSSGIGSGGGAAAASTSSSSTSSGSNLLNVSLTNLASDGLYSGSDISSLFDSLGDEAKARGLEGVRFT